MQVVLVVWDFGGELVLWMNVVFMACLCWLMHGLMHCFAGFGLWGGLERCVVWS